MFTVITPTLLRKSLVKACESIDNQNSSVQHIVMVDKDESLLTDSDKQILESIRNKHREIRFTGKITGINDYGNNARNMAYQYVKGDYIFYLDDDDYYINRPFQSISLFILNNDNPDIVIFPIRRYGDRFFNIPAGRTRTCSNQFCHKPYFANTFWQWLAAVDYEADGIFLEEMINRKGSITKYFDSPLEYAEVKFSNLGK